jgi:molybdopterin-guanine dinucleotide biosynthesis protein A
MRAHSNAAFLVVAIDLPLLSLGTLGYLRELRNPLQFATCYRSFGSNSLEPLCAIYEPKAFPAMLNFLAHGVTCPRRMLQQLGVIGIQQLGSSDVLMNVNTPKEFESILPALRFQNELN